MIQCHLYDSSIIVIYTFLSPSQVRQRPKFNATDRVIYFCGSCISRRAGQPRPSQRLGGWRPWRPLRSIWWPVAKIVSRKVEWKCVGSYTRASGNIYMGISTQLPSLPMMAVAACTTVPSVHWRGVERARGGFGGCCLCPPARRARRCCWHNHFCHR